MVQLSGRSRSVRKPTKSLDITDMVIAADAMHTQRATADYITGRSGHFVMTVKRNQTSLYTSLKALPWKQIGVLASSTDTRRGRRITRTIFACEVPQGLDFGAHRTGRQNPSHRHIKRHKTVEIAYRITDLTMIQAQPQAIAAWIQGHWGRKPVALRPRCHLRRRRLPHPHRI